MSLTAKDVAEIIRLLENSSFDELELEAGDIKLSLRRGESGVAHAAPPSARASRAATSPASGAGSGAEILTRETGEGDREAVEGARGPRADGAIDVPSPLLGIFYRAPKPGEAAFIEVGAQVGEDTVIGIIEVMKLMNSVRAGVKGEVVEILAANAGLVEYGETLVRVRPA